MVIKAIVPNANMVMRLAFLVLKKTTGTPIVGQGIVTYANRRVAIAVKITQRETSPLIRRGLVYEK